MLATPHIVAQNYKIVTSVKMSLVNHLELYSYDERYHPTHVRVTQPWVPVTLLQVQRDLEDEFGDEYVSSCTRCTSDKQTRRMRRIQPVQYDNLETRNVQDTQSRPKDSVFPRVFVFVFVTETGCEFQFPLLRATLTC